MKWTHSDATCVDCLGLEQCVEHNSVMRCEGCWHAYAVSHGLCLDCGEECESGKLSRCFHCEGEHRRSYRFWHGSLGGIA